MAGSTTNQIPASVTTAPAKALIAGTSDAGLDGLSVQYVVILDPNNPTNKITPGQMTGGFMPTNPRLLTTADMVSIGIATTGGLTTYYQANPGALALVKSTQGCLSGIVLNNGLASANQAWLQVFNASSTGAVTLGTTAPIVELFAPALTSATLNLPAGIAFTSGIVVAVTTLTKGSVAITSGASITLAYV